MESRTEVKVVEIDYNCPQCTVGKMRPTGIVLTSYPAQYPHKCNECGYNENFYKTYPFVEYIK